MAVIYGTTGPDTKNGTSGNDTIYGWATGGNATSPSAKDTLEGKAGNDKLYGGTDNDRLYGDEGNDTLDGGSGSDTLNGGKGNDTYIVDSSSDIITGEGPNGGTDTVRSSVSWTLGDYLQNLTLTGTKASNGTGNNLDNTITGNNADNTLMGGDPLGFEDSGNDTLYGLDGNDELYGIGGNDFLDGGAGDDDLLALDGSDTLLGGDGNDQLYDNSSGADDEFYGGNGNDVLDGSDGKNQLYGEAGNDTLINREDDEILDGGDGFDLVDYSYIYSGVGVTVNLVTGTASGVSNDQLFSIEGASGTYGNDTLIGNAENNILSGDPNEFDSVLVRSGNDSLDGGSGNDSLDGGSGNDSLDGGSGADWFIFNSRPPYAGIDTITDFRVADDSIQVLATYFGSGLTAGATIMPEQFTIGAAAADASDRFIYNQNTGALFFDSDGTGTTEQEQFAQLFPGLTMTNADIFVV